ncbi:MAG: hypothetical protein JW993_20790 [Sedimentisphaerales bacterium]|nr:hypothetical protein [Sedimentisphaerales bacterium]
MRATRPARVERMHLSTTVWFGLWALAFLVGASGCATKRYLSPNRLPYDMLSMPYRQTQLKASPTLDVLGIADTSEYQLDDEDVGRTLLTQSNVAVALSGQSEDTYKTWVNLIVFDEYRMTAARKYFFCSDERATVAPDNPRRLLIPPRRGVIFDSQCVLPPEILTTPYATEEARLIAIVRWQADQFATDVQDLTGAAGSMQANELVALSSRMMNQTFRGVLGELAQSPGLARDLAREEGFAFPHLSLNEGRIHLTVTNDVVTTKIRVNLPM